MSSSIITLLYIQKNSTDPQLAVVRNLPPHEDPKLEYEITVRHYGLKNELYYLITAAHLSLG